jgi:hypothetical protein
MTIVRTAQSSGQRPFRPGRSVSSCGASVSAARCVLCLCLFFQGGHRESSIHIDRTADVVNCGITEYVYEEGTDGGDGRLALKRYHFLAPLQREGAPVTNAPDRSGAPR